MAYPEVERGLLEVVGCLLLLVDGLLQSLVVQLEVFARLEQEFSILGNFGDNFWNLGELVNHGSALDLDGGLVGIPAHLLGDLECLLELIVPLLNALRELLRLDLDILADKFEVDVLNWEDKREKGLR